MPRMKWNDPPLQFMVNANTHSCSSKCNVCACSKCWHFHKWLSQVCAGRQQQVWIPLMLGSPQIHTHTRQWHLIFYLCVCVRIIWCHRKKKLTEEQLVVWSVLLLWGITVWKEKKCDCSQAHVRSGSSRGRFDWTPGCAHAVSLSELNLANSWLKGCCLSVCGSVSFIHLCWKGNVLHHSHPPTPHYDT